MRVQTILNWVEKFKSFVYGEARLEKLSDGLALVVKIRPRKNSKKPICSCCGRRGVAYDRLKNDDSSSCRCGESWSAWPTGCGE
jgi:hypothetical protein